MTYEEASDLDNVELIRRVLKAEDADLIQLELAMRLLAATDELNRMASESQSKKQELAW